MNTVCYRLSAAVIAAATILSMALEPAIAQPAPGAPTVGPAGGVGSTTAPTNGDGTPSGGTGVLGTTRVGPGGVTPAPAPVTAPPDAAPAPVARRRYRHRRRHRVVRPAAQVGTQSQDGTNGAAAPSR